MQFLHTESTTNGKLSFIHQHSWDDRNTNTPDSNEFLTIALNTGPDQKVVLDGIGYNFSEWSILPLVAEQSFSFERPEQITVWQYNRDFYCLVDANYEISCIGFLFFGFVGNPILLLDEVHRKKMESLLQMFIEEFDTNDSIKTDMLQILLKRLIIITTRLAKEQYVENRVIENDKFDIIRQFNVLVYKHFRKEHKVQFYAGLLNKSPKTLSNLFSLYNYKSPSLIIYDKIITEAKRLFFYTDKSAKEIAFELGFLDAAHFSRFFKNLTNQNPSDFRKHKLPVVAGD